MPSAPDLWARPSNFSDPRAVGAVANRLEIDSWSALRTFTAKRPPSRMAGKHCALWATQTRMSGG